ncbi:phosphodiesterase [Rhodococcus sp. NPDC058639]|uniref:phosphodiesterase n=1 Tax=Rhodococcus sp. NPDC058639 TaxID=3346570 RepID=UPI003660F134
MPPLDLSRRSRSAGPLRSAVSGVFRAASALRGARAFHPEGALFRGHLDVQVEGGPVPPGRYDVTGRLSRGIGLPAGVPDILGLALRVSLESGPWDLLLATSYLPARAVLLPVRGWESARYSSVAAYRRYGDDRVRWVLATPVGRQPNTTSADDLRPEVLPLVFSLGWAPARGPALRFGDVTLTSRLAVDDSAMTSFDPVVHCPPTLRMWPDLVAEMRRDAYRGSRAGRGASLDA